MYMCYLPNEVLTQGIEILVKSMKKHERQIDFNGKRVLKDTYICSMTTKVSESHFKIPSREVTHL
jgi:hypothetical protein